MKVLEWSQHYSYILDAQGQLTLWLVDGCGGKSNSFKLLWKPLLPTNEEDPFENEGARVVTTDLPLQIFDDAQGIKNKEDQIKNEGTRVVTTLSANF